MLNFALYSPRAARKNYNAVPDRPLAEAGAQRPRRPGHEIMEYIITNSLYNLSFNLKAAFYLSPSLILI